MIRLPVIILSVFAAVLTAVVLTSPAVHATAAEGIEVVSEAAQNRFPNGASFTIFLSSDADITLVRLRSRVLPDGNSVATRPQCTTGSRINCTAVIGASQASYMVPGAEVRYFWEAEDASGRKIETAQATFVYQDNRFRWESLTDRNVTVFYYFGDDATNQAVLRASRETIDRFSALEGTQLEFPVKVWVYQTARDLQDAAGGRQVPNGHTLGQVGASDTAIVSRDVDFLNVVRHELAHIVTRRATRDHAAELPIWINEGLSTYGQTRLLPGEEQAFSVAVRQNRVLPISSLSGAIRGPEFPLAYAQSGSIVKYLVETHGQPKFAEFIAAFRNENLDGALKVYGMDELGLENAWRRSVGLPEVTGGTNAGREVEIPTITPLGSNPNQGRPAATPASGTQPGATASETDDGSPVLLIAIGGAAAAVVLSAGGFYLYRRRA